MNIRQANKEDFVQLAEMKWCHCSEDDIDYGEHNLDGVNKDNFINEFISFLTQIIATKYLLQRTNKL